MRESKFSESQIAEILKEAEGGMAVTDLARKRMRQCAAMACRKLPMRGR